MKPRKIILIEDDSDDRIFFKLALNSIDSTIDLTVSPNGLEGLNELRSNLDQLPDCIFLDLNMPVMDGKDCLRELKKDAQLAHIPVFILTTSSSSTERDELIKKGAKDFISKPSDMNKLTSAIENALQTIGTTSSLS